jgi:hypothetical protein
MRTEKPTLAARAAARFRSQIVRFRRALAAQGPAFRWSLVLGALALLALIGYLATPVSATSEFLRGGQKFSSGDIIKISNALDAQRIEYRVDDQGRIEVASDRREDIKTVLAKLGLGPRSIEDLDREAQETNPWDGPWDKEQRQNKGREEILAAMIRKFDGIISAYVTINRPRSRGMIRPGANASARPTAFVWLETDGGREIGHKTVQSIQNLMVGNEPDLKPDAVTVFDQKGRHYLVAGDPKYSTISATRAREEDLAQRILEQIDWVEGVRVTVQVVAAPASVPQTVPTPAPAPIAALPLASTAAAAPVRSPEPTGPALEVGVNTPLELESEARPEPQPEPQPEPEPRLNPNPTSTLPSNSEPAMTSRPVPVVSASTLPEPAGLPRGEVARVWVRVPRSYYYSKAGTDRDLSPDRLQPIVQRTESLIRVAVGHVVPPELTPPGEGGPDLKIDTIPDDEPASIPLRSQVTADVRRPLSWWLPAAAAGVGLIVLLSALGVRLLAWRVPAVRYRRGMAPSLGRYRSDAASEPGPGPGPAERVRELIRLKPEAAASVLHRWIGQGESLG